MNSAATPMAERQMNLVELLLCPKKEIRVKTKRPARWSSQCCAKTRPSHGRWPTMSRVVKEYGAAVGEGLSTVRGALVSGQSTADLLGTRNPPNTQKLPLLPNQSINQYCHYNLKIGVSLLTSRQTGVPSPSEKKQTACWLRPRCR